MTSISGGIGGVPAMPEISASSSDKKIAEAENKLQQAFLQISQLSNKPQLQAKLQASFDLIKSNFLKILSIKYQLSTQVITDDLAALKELANLEAQIDVVTQQIDDLNTELSLLNTQLTTDQSNLAADQSEFDAVLNALQNQIISFSDKGKARLNNINTNLNTIASRLQEIYPPINGQPDPRVSNYLSIINPFVQKLNSGADITSGDLNTLVANLNNFLSIQITDPSIKAELQPLFTSTTDDIRQTISDVLNSYAVRLSNLNDMITALEASIASTQADIAAKDSELAAKQSELSSLQQQLADLPNAQTFYQSLTDLEKTLLRELYPDIVFPV